LEIELNIEIIVPCFLLESEFDSVLFLIHMDLQYKYC
jgi:hypothetical protein